MLGDDQARVAARRAHRARQPGHDAGLAFGGGGQRHDGQAAAAARCAAQKVDRTAHGTHIHTGGHLGVDLAGQVHLDGRVDGGQLVAGGEHLGVVGVVGAAQCKLGVAVRPAAHFLAAHQDAANAHAGVQALLRVGQHTGLGQGSDAVAHRTAVQPQVAVAMQRGQHGLGQVADAQLQRGAVLDQRGDMARDGLLHRPGRGAALFQWRMLGVDEQREIAGLQVHAAVGPGDGGVDLANHYACLLQRGGQVFLRQAQAVAALIVGWRDLQQHHVGGQHAGADQARQVRVMAGQDVEHAGFGQAAVRSTRGVAKKIDDVGLFGLQRVRCADAYEHPQPPALCQRMAMFHQRPRERERLGRGLAPPQGVAGADQCLQLLGQQAHVHSPWCCVAPASRETGATQARAAVQGPPRRTGGVPLGGWRHRRLRGAVTSFPSRSAVAPWP